MRSPAQTIAPLRPSPADNRPQVPQGPDDWRLHIPEPDRRRIARWLWTIVAMTAAILAVGGITRLTQSGLSIVRWEPLMGVIPPLGDAQWTERFEQYRQFPEYQQLRQAMTLAEFKTIFFWEYLHRLLARGLGVVFLVPFVVFWAKGRLTRPLLLRMLALFGLGAAQGLMGWLMVVSGLVDRPSVSHFRLAAHLCLALLIVSVAVWLARDMAVGSTRPTLPDRTRRAMRQGTLVVGVLLWAQLAWGAFVAGLDAGLSFNTFPLMAGRLVPPHVFAPGPVVLNLLQQPPAVQWMHRVLGTLLLAATATIALRSYRGPETHSARRLAMMTLAAVIAQYVLGVLTLLWAVPLALGVAHQVTALVIVVVWVSWLTSRLAHRRRPRTDASACALGALTSRPTAGRRRSACFGAAMTREVADDRLALLGCAGHASSHHVGDRFAPPVLGLTEASDDGGLVTTAAQLLHERARGLVWQARRDRTRREWPRPC